MNYWLDLFTGTTWDEFQKAGASVTGFTHRMRKTVQSIQTSLKPDFLLRTAEFFAAENKD